MERRSFLKACLGVAVSATLAMDLLQTKKPELVTIPRATLKSSGMTGHMVLPENWTEYKIGSPGLIFIDDPIPEGAYDVGWHEKMWKHYKALKGKTL